MTTDNKEFIMSSNGYYFVIKESWRMLVGGIAFILGEQLRL